MNLYKIISKKFTKIDAILTSETIYNNFLNKGIINTTTTDILIAFVEESFDDNLRIKSLELLGEINHKTKSIFEFFENILLSDENDSIRAKAAELLFKLYPNECFNSIKHVIQHENSSLVLRTLVEILKGYKNNDFKILNKELKNKLVSIYGIYPEEAIFLLDLEKEISFFNLDYFKMYSSNSLHGVISSIHYYMMCSIDRGHIIALNLSKWGLERIPESIYYLSELKYLILQSNNIKELPESIGLLQNLEILDLQSCDLQRIPDSLLNLKNLKYFSLNQNKNMKKISVSLISIAKQHFSKKYIMAGVNSDEAFIIGLLEILSGIKLDRVDENDYISYKENAYHYKLNKNGNIIGIYLFNSKFNYLNIIPEQICYLKHLTELELPNNNISNIPNKIDKLTSLNVLNLRNNLIKKIPDSLKELKLTSLKLAGNRIKNPPEWIKAKLDRFECVEDLNGFKRYFFGIPLNEIIKRFPT